MENKHKTHMLSPLEVRSEQILFKNGNICSSSCPGIYWSWFVVLFLFLHVGNMFFFLSEEIQLLYHWVNMNITLKRILSPSTKKYRKVFFFRIINYDSDSYSAIGKGGQDQILGSELNQISETYFEDFLF